MTVASSPAARRTRAVESFGNASLAIGPVVPGLSVFAITRGQFSMIDAILHVIDACKPAKLTLWTWTIADYEVQAFTSLLGAGISEARLVIDPGGRKKNADLIRVFRDRFGPGSVKIALNHAKIALVEGNGLRVLLRGSMNLNFNPRFEQLDVTEGGPDFDLVERVMSELPTLGETAQRSELVSACKLNDAFDRDQLALFDGVKRWAK